MENCVFAKLGIDNDDVEVRNSTLKISCNWEIIMSFNTN